ncbi:hypothetical protein ACFQ9X_18465 [Catenulispora yoronensis]
MQAQEEFRSRLREDLTTTSQPPVGALAADALAAGRRIRRRQRTLRAVGGTAAVAVVAVGSAAIAGSFGSDTGSGPGVGAVGPGAVRTTATAPSQSAPSQSAPTRPDPSRSSTSPTAPSRTHGSWTVPPAAKVKVPEWVTPRAIVAQAEHILPAGTQFSALSGDYAWAGGDPASCGRSAAV